jgi:DNA-binding PadR family transcriptional regulator
MKFPAELLKGSIKRLILAVLADGEKYGYQISKAISERSQETLEFGEGSIYPALHSLEKSGLLQSRWVSQKDLPDRKYYSLTEKGQQTLQLSLEEWKLFVHSVNNVLGDINHGTSS